MRFFVLLFIVTALSLSGCWNQTNVPIEQSRIKVTNNSQRVVSIHQTTSVPCFEDCTSTHVGYARAQYDNLFRTVSHVLTTNLDHITIQWNGACWIKQLWNHPTQDLSLIQTVWTCLPWIGSGVIGSWKQHQWTILTNNTSQSVVVIENEWFLVASWLMLAPWMSWSPLISSNWELIWLVHAQTERWTTFINIGQWWESLLSLSEK